MQQLVLPSRTLARMQVSPTRKPHPSQTQGPATGLTFQVERMEMAGAPAVTMPQLVAVMVPEAALPERQLSMAGNRQGGCRGGSLAGRPGIEQGVHCGSAQPAAEQQP